VKVDAGRGAADNSHMDVRRATRTDLGALVDIYNHYVLTTVATFDVDPCTVDDRQAWFDQFDDAHPLLVATVDAEVVGYAYYLPFRRKPAYGRAKECTVYVAHGWHGRGVGTGLYTVLIERAAQRGVHALLGVLGGDNPASVRLHERFGFVCVGHLRQVGFKFGGFVDTHYYEKILSPP
jgi:phosphinothricin acetyltransferase